MTRVDDTALSAERPFPGLRPYDFDDHPFYFGREDQIFSLYRLLDRSHFIAVVGSSGSGKSSLVRAGLLPLLESETSNSGGRSWRRLEMRPGAEPLGQLADALAVLLPDADDDVSQSVNAARRERIAFALRKSSFGVAEALGEIGDLGATSLVLVVDQFEELFRYPNANASQRGDAAAASRRREDAAHFVQLLLEASRHRTRPIHVIVTMRSDFIGDCARFHGLPEAVSATQFLVPSLTRDQREEIIRKPVEKAEATIEATLVERILNDSGDELDQLPVMQHCLMRLWERAGLEPARPRHLSVAHYHAVGGMAGALAEHAEEILASLPGLELAVEQVFRALAEIDRAGRAIRRVVPFAQLIAETGIPEDQLRKVVDRLRADDCSFLVPSLASVPELKPSTAIDVGHEALLRRWERISGDPVVPGQGWLRSEDNDARVYRGLLALVDSEVGGRTTLPLDQVEARSKWWTSRPRSEAWTERYGGGRERVQRLFDNSLAALTAARKAAEREAAAQSRRFKVAVAGFAVFAILAALAGWAAFRAHENERRAYQNEQEALEARREALERGAEAKQSEARARDREVEAKQKEAEAKAAQSRLVANLAEQTPNDHATRILLALEALPLTPEEERERPLSAKALKSLSDGLQDLREIAVIHRHAEALTAVALTSNGTRIVTGSEDKSARIWDADTGRELLRLDGHAGTVTSVAATPDGRLIVTGSEDKTARVWSTEQRAEPVSLNGHARVVSSVAVTPDGTRVVTGSRDRTARLWDARTGAVLLELKGHADGVESVAVTADGARIVTGSADRTARIWNATNGAVLHTLKGHAGVVKSVAVTPDATRVVTGSSDNTVIVWDAETGNELLRYTGHTDDVTALGITADGHRIVTASNDRTARVWDARTLDRTPTDGKTAKELLLIQGHTGVLTGIAVTPDGTRVVTVSRARKISGSLDDDNTIRIWDARTAFEALELKRSGLVTNVAMTSDGARVVTGARAETVEGVTVYENVARVWDTKTGAELRQLKGHTGAVSTVAVTPDGSRIITGSLDGTARLWDPVTGTELRSFKGHSGAITGVAVTPDGTRIIAVAGARVGRVGSENDNTGRVWDAETAAELVQLKGHAAGITSVAVMPNGRAITGSLDRTARIWNINTGDLLLELKGHSNAIMSVAVTPDGTRIVTGSLDRTARIWNAQTGAELHQLKGHAGGISSVAVTPDGTRIVTGSSDSTVLVWEARTGLELAHLRVGDRLSALAAGDDRVVTVAFNTARMFDLAQLRPRLVKTELSRLEDRQRLFERAKVVVPRCLTIEQRRELMLSPMPPSWCTEQRKYPYETPVWRTEGGRDERIAARFANFADTAIKNGDFRSALDASDRALQFGPEVTWSRINRAHALMFLGRIQEARDEYLGPNRGKKPLAGDERIWEQLIIDDFAALRTHYRNHRLMQEIEELFKVPLP